MEGQAHQNEVMNKTRLKTTGLDALTKAVCLITTTFFTIHAIHKCLAEKPRIPFYKQDVHFTG